MPDHRPRPRSRPLTPQEQARIEDRAQTLEEARRGDRNYPGYDHLIVNHPEGWREP